MTRSSRYRTLVPFSLAVLAWTGFTPLAAMPPKRAKATPAPAQQQPSLAQLQAALAALLSAAAAQGNLDTVLQGLSQSMGAGSLVVDPPGPLGQHTCHACGLAFAYQRTHAQVLCPGCGAVVVTSPSSGSEEPAQPGPEAEG